MSARPDAEVYAVRPREALAPVEARSCRAADVVSWDAYARRRPDASFFHLSGWRRVVGRVFGHEDHSLCAWRGGELAGILPLVRVRSRLFGHALISTGFATYGGILADDPVAEVALARGAVALGRSLGVDHVELRHVAERLLDSGWRTKSSLYCTFRKPLPADADAILAWMPQKRRNVARKALKDPELSVEDDADPRVVHRVYAESVRNLGTPLFPYRLFEAMRDEFGPAQVRFSAVRVPRGAAIASALSIWFGGSVCPYFVGATPGARPRHGYDLLYLSLMRRAIREGTRIFDFGRSKRGTGSFDFKTYWGFEPQPLHYQFFLVNAPAVPDMNPLNPKYRLMVEAWKRLPLPVANFVGPFISRQIG